VYEATVTKRSDIGFSPAGGGRGIVGGVRRVVNHVGRHLPRPSGLLRLPPENQTSRRGESKDRRPIMRSVPRRCFGASVLAALCYFLLAGGEPSVTARPEGKSGSDLLKGKWVCVSTKKDGKDVKTYVGVRAVMEGDNLTWYFPQKDGSFREQKVKFRIDPGKDPKQFDWWDPEKPKAVEMRIYAVTEKELRWGTNLDRKTRPKSFEEAKWQFVMKRAPSGSK
jgi:uncharacterized protein (TIGR03067 family)